MEKVSTSHFDLLTRMLLSCLVAADRLDTAGREIVQGPLGAANRLATLLDYLSELATKSPEGTVKKAPGEVLEDWDRRNDPCLLV